MALVHSRFSTNTFPSWELAHPYRMIAHNGEINTLRGNINWMRARESALASELFGDDLQKVIPLVRPGGSDSATFDNVLELLTLAGRSLPHAVMMMIPEAYRNRDDLPAELVGFYAFHSCLMEPWDGPAAVAFTDGRVIGATLDRNGLRPGRWIGHQGRPCRARLRGRRARRPARADVERLGRLQPGKLFLVDLEQGRIVADDEVKHEVGRPPAVRRLVRRRARSTSTTCPSATGRDRSTEPLALAPAGLRLHAGGSARAARADGRDGEEPIGSMGNDTPLAVLSDRGAAALQLLQAALRPGHQPADRPDPRADRDEPGDQPRQRAQPARRDARARPQADPRPADPPQRRARDRSARSAATSSRPHTIDITWPVADGPDGWRAALARICAEADDAIAAGDNILILSDRGSAPTASPIPSLLAVAAVHHHLVREGTRLRAALVLESGEPREVHHFATLIGYGASAINPYLMFETVGAARDRRPCPDKNGSRRRVEAAEPASSRRSARGS